MRLKAAIALCIFALPLLVQARDADVCYSPNVGMGQTGLLTASTPLNCPAAGKHTLPELAQAGWTFALIQSVSVDQLPDAITKVPGHFAWMVVIEKPNN